MLAIIERIIQLIRSRNFQENEASRSPRRFPLCLRQSPPYSVVVAVDRIHITSDRKILGLRVTGRKRGILFRRIYSRRFLGWDEEEKRDREQISLRDNIYFGAPRRPSSLLKRVIEGQVSMTTGSFFFGFRDSFLLLLSGDREGLPLSSRISDT